MSLGKFPDFLLKFSGCKMNGQESHSYCFKSFRLDVGERQLFHGNIPVSLEPKVFDVLAVLVERSGHLIEKDELLNLVWSDSFVEETNIARSVYTLRRVLGEKRGGQKFIETVAKKGYRFVAKVTEVHEPNGDTATRRHADAATVEEESPRPRVAVSPLPNLKPKQNTRIILFSVGFLCAVFLILLLSFDFQSGSSGNPNEVRSIAVLPLKPINTANRDEIYEFGIAETLIHQLSSIKGFIVRPLSATRKYTDIEQDPMAAGREQKVDYILASNYQLAGGKIRITAQLINVANGQIEHTYKSERDAGDLFGMQDAFANEVGNKLLSRFATTSDNFLAKRGTTNEEAYRLYLHGKILTSQRTAKDAQKAIEYFEQSVRLDPNFARAYAGMAFAYRASGSLGGGLPREQFEKAKESVNKALELDSDLAEAYAVRGDLKPKYERDWAGGEKDLLRAIELEPNNDLAHSIYAELLAERFSRFDDALAQEEIALAINPNSLVYQRDRGRILYFARRYDEAILQLKQVVEVDENFQTAYGWLWYACAMKGDDMQAFEFLIKHQKIRDLERVEPLQKAYETVGWQAVLQKNLELIKLDEHKSVTNYYEMARICAMLNEKEQVFEYLNKTIEKGQSQIVMLNVEPAFDPIRDDPRYEELLRRIGLK
jgi:DNA-binding winged helix-turn-helix (wHTH) protein/TolB-like protein/Tfp pilus assembly protein PilF